MKRELGAYMSLYRSWLLSRTTSANEHAEQIEVRVESTEMQSSVMGGGGY
jgi:hypothetical protein